MSKPKRHHYLPQFYLELFCRDGGFWVFDREEVQYREQTPKNTALKTHYYSISESDGTKDNQIEELLAQIEGRAKQVISKLLRRESIVADEKEELSLFIAFMMNRVPDFEKSINKVQKHMIRKIADMMFSDEKRAQEIMDQQAAETGEKSKISAKELVEFHKSGQYEIVIHRNESLRLMLELSMDFANLFRQMDWGIFYAPEKASFITTDNPVIVLPPKGYKRNFYGFGILTEGTKKVFPLSEKACLIMFDHGSRLVHGDINRDTVRAINLNLAGQCDRFVIGRDEALVRNLVGTTKLTERKREGRIAIS